LGLLSIELVYKNLTIFLNFRIIMRNKQIQEKLSELEKRLLVLNKTLHEDIGASYREATQTSEMIEMLEIQILDLKKEQKNEKGILKMIQVKGNGIIKVFILLEQNGNPQELSFSISSPFGQILNSVKIGDKIKFRENEYLVKKIDE